MNPFSQTLYGSSPIHGRRRLCLVSLFDGTLGVIVVRIILDHVLLVHLLIHHAIDELILFYFKCQLTAVDRSLKKAVDQNSPRMADFPASLVSFFHAPLTSIGRSVNFSVREIVLRWADKAAPRDYRAAVFSTE